MNRKRVSQSVIRRLPRYYRYLSELLNQNRGKISSKELSELLHVTSSQIRQDFNCFGGFGQQGYGYNVEYLHDQIGKILGLHQKWNVVLLGAGNLGKALANYGSLTKYNYEIIGIFDKDLSKIGTVVGQNTVRDVSELDAFFKEYRVDIGILAVPREFITEVAERLISLGVKGLWNFSFAELSPKTDVAIENVHMSDSLMALSYKMTCKESDKA